MPSPVPKSIAAVLICALLALAALVAVKFAPYAGGADSSGYFNSARILLEGRFSDPIRRPPELVLDDDWPVTPLGMIAAEGGSVFHPTYPVGLPLHLAVGKLIAGWEGGSTLVGVFCMLATGFLMYHSLRALGLGYELATTGTAAVILGPVFLSFAMVPMSDALATTWIVAALYFALTSRERGLAALCCGASFSIAVLVRPTNVLFVPALALILRDRKSMVLAALGSLPGAIWCAYYNNALYGSPLSFGYGNVSGLFSTENAWKSFWHFVVWMPVLFPLSLAALVTLPYLPWRRMPLAIAGLAAGVLIPFGFYAFYYHTHEAWWYLRFVLPAFAPIAMLAMLGVEGAIQRLQKWPVRRVRNITAGAIMAVILASSFGWGSHFRILKQKRGEGEYARVAAWANENLPENSLVACMQHSGALNFYTKFPILRWDMLDGKKFDPIADALRHSRRPLYAILYSFEEEQGALDTRMPGKWEEVVQIENTKVWRFGP